MVELPAGIDQLDSSLVHIDADKPHAMTDTQTDYNTFVKIPACIIHLNFGLDCKEAEISELKVYYFNLV